MMTVLFMGLGIILLLIIYEFFLTEWWNSCKCSIKSITYTCKI